MEKVACVGSLAPTSLTVSRGVDLLLVAVGVEMMRLSLGLGLGKLLEVHVAAGLEIL